jgi:isopropylmalate/homocitrate/citramalate synthase
VNVPLAVHCHNDFGLALANSLAALSAGANCVHVSVNCLGERAGNVDLAEVVVALQALYGVHTGINTELLTKTSRFIEEISGNKVAVTKPIVGSNIFTRVAGGVVQQLLISPPSVEPYEPELVGLEREVVLGKLSGKYSILYALEGLGLQASYEQVNSLVTQVKSLSVDKRRLVTNDEFAAMARRLISGG